MTNDESNPNVRMTNDQSFARRVRPSGFGHSIIAYLNLIRHSSFVIRGWSVLALLAGFAACLCMQSCKTGADYRRPELEMPATFKSATQPSSQPAPRLARDWWKLFGDPQLTVLEEAATKYNPDLQAAMERVIQARETAKAVKSQFYPVITFDPSVRRARATGSGRGGASSTSTTVQVPFDLSYEVDVWGRIRRAYESSNAQAEASTADYFVVLQTLQSDVAQNYFNLRSLDAQQKILSENVALYREQLALTRTQFNVGLVDPTAVLQVQTLLDSTESQAIDIRRQRADLEHALAILTGHRPSELSLAINPLTDPPPIIPPGLPIDLLRQRPDVAEAEQNLIAANADVGVAQADFLPKITLTGAAGLESFDTRHIVDWESRVWSLAPAVSAPIFNGGQLNAQLRQAQSRYQEQLATFRSTVLSALRDVEDSLNDLHFHADQALAQKRAVDAAHEYLRLSEIQKKQGGLISQLQLLDADRTLLTNELAEQQILNQRLVSTVLLIKALGGGWQAPGAATQPDARATLLPGDFPSALPTALPPPLPSIAPATAPATGPAMR